MIIVNLKLNGNCKLLIENCYPGPEYNTGMVATYEALPKESAKERLSRLARNFNALGALALGGLAVLLPGPNVVLGTLAGINAAQAAGFELLRSHAQKSRKKRLQH